MSSHRIGVTVNGAHHELAVEGRTLLCDALRHGLGLLGTHAACEQGVCGTCTVLLDGNSVRSCLMFAVQADGTEITTIEGVAGPDGLHPFQDAISRHHGVQCGFCTAGVVMTALEVLADESIRTREAITTAMSGQLCRCTGYVGIVDAVQDVLAGSRTEGSA